MWLHYLGKMGAKKWTAGGLLNERWSHSSTRPGQKHGMILDLVKNRHLKQHFAGESWKICVHNESVTSAV